MQALEERLFPGSGRARATNGSPSPDPSRVNLILGQSMFRPNKLLRDETGHAAIAANRPYAGWLYGGLALHRPFDDNHGLTTVELDVGVVGPKSFAADAQTWWRKPNGWAPFVGWEHQIPTEPTLQLSFRRSQILTQLTTAAASAPLGLNSDVLWDYGFSLGTPHTMAAVNMRIRVGLDLPNDFGPARIRPSIAGYDPFQTGLRHAYAFAGVGAQATLYDAFLDGTLFHDSPRVSKRPGVVEAQLGVVLPLKIVRVGATVVRRSREFDGPWGEVEEFWSLSFSLLCAAQPKVACY